MLTKLSREHKEYCAIKFALDMICEFKNFMKPEAVESAKIIMLETLKSDLHLSKDEMNHLEKMLGI